jgi:diguanylate cyclase (GGDEF)-like protein/PAS domain S-box-containing protein
MKWIEKVSLRRRLSLPIIVFTASLFIMLQGYNYVSTYDTQKKNLINRVKVLSNGVSINLQSSLLINDKVLATEILHAFSVDDEILQALLIKKEGSLFAEFRKNEAVIKEPNMVLQEKIIAEGYAVGQSAIYVLMPVKLGNKKVAQIRLIVSKSELDTTSRQALQVTFILCCLIIVFCYFFISKIRHLITTPVTNLNHAMRGIIERGEFNQRPEVMTKDELGDLTFSFNRMADRLEERQNQLRFVFNKVEHERDFGKQIIAAVQHGLFVVDKEGKVLLSNDASKKLFPRLTRENRVDVSFLDILNPLEKNTLSGILKTFNEVDDLLVKTLDNYALQITARVLSNKDQLLFSVVDVTESVKSRTQQKLAANVFKNSQDGVLIFDSSGNLTLINPAFTEIFGYEPEELINLSMQELFDGHHFTMSKELITESIYRFGQWHGEVLEKDKQGDELPLYIKASKIIDEEQYGEESYIFIFTSLFDSKEKERLDYLAHHDRLTGLPNRSKFYQTANKIITMNQDSIGHIGLCYLDLDGFKAVNDTYGHDAGDEVLKAIAKRLEHSIKEKGLACRLAGDEFVLFINSVVNETQLIELSNRVIESIKHPIYYQDNRLSVGASIGMTIAKYSDEKGVDCLLKEADSAMYQAKLAGKGQYIFHNSEKMFTKLN